MKTRKTVFLSAKTRKTPKININQKELFENNLSKQYKKSKYYNLSLNINNNNKERIYGLVSPKNKYHDSSSKFLGSYTVNNISSLTKKKKFGSLSLKNIFSTINIGPRNPSFFPTVSNNRGLVKSPSEMNHHIYNSRFFKIEDEKLSQEIYYLKKDIEIMNKELYFLDIENKEKEKILAGKENEINAIIHKNNNNYSINEIIANEYKDNNYYILNAKEESKELSNYFDITLNNYNYNNLFVRIRHQILKAFKEIKEKEEEISNNKKTLFYTKMNEIDLEADLYKEQINKIITLIDNAESIYHRNQIKLNECELLENKIKEQQKIINGLNKEYYNLKNDEYKLNEKIKIMGYLSKKKNLKKKNNCNLIENLQKKNIILSKDELILTKFNISKMTEDIKVLKKNLKLFKFHYNHTNSEIGQLKEKRDNIIKTSKININDLKNYGKKKTKTIEYKNYSLNTNKMYLKKKAEELSLEYDNKIQIEKYLEKQLKKYQKKYDKIFNDNNDQEEENLELNNEDNNNEDNDNENTNNVNNNNENNNNDNDGNNNINNEEGNLDKDIKNEMTESNPYYSADENNLPEKTNKFNKRQFIEFEYILFKNFESKSILSNESKNKIIDPLINIISQKNIKEIKYNNDSYNLIIDELTKLIMNVLENNNQKNRKLISIFIGSLIHNSNYNINILLKYINFLFSYTHNHSEKEEKLKLKLQTKYKEQLILLYNKLNEYIQNNLSSSESNNYIPILKVKEIIENNNIQLKEKYCEFLYYFMKKFKDPNSNLDDLDFDLLNNLFIDSTNSNENESVTEITNENYEKQLKEAIETIKNGTNKINLSFGEMVKNITYKAEINGIFYDYFTIENFNEELKKNKIKLSDLQLSCLCNKYCLPDNLKCIDKNKIEKDIIQ